MNTHEMKPISPVDFLLDETTPEDRRRARDKVADALHDARASVQAACDEGDLLLALLSQVLRSMGQSLYLGSTYRRGDLSAEQAIAIANRALARYHAWLVFDAMLDARSAR